MRGDAMKLAPREHLVQPLRARGFKRSLPHFRRVGEAGIDLLTVQFDSEAVTSLSRSDGRGTAGITTSLGKAIRPGRHRSRPSSAHAAPPRLARTE